MTPDEILAEVKVLLSAPPDLNNFGHPDARAWLGRAHALVSLRDEWHGRELKSASDGLAVVLMREYNITIIFNTLERVRAQLEIELGAKPQVFGPGAVYDFNRELRGVLASATTEVFVVDPYLDAEIFDAYVEGIPTSVSVRLLVRIGSSSFTSALAKFRAQSARPVEARASSQIHDRVVFIDKSGCVVIGQSIKDAAKSKTTYLAPLSSDAAPLKLAFYEQAWQSAQVL